MMRRTIWTWVAGAAAVVGVAGPARAELKLHALLTDKAVLQQQMKLPVWGTTDSNDKVTVKFAGQEISAQPQDGKWKAELAPLEASAEGRTLTVTQGGTTVERKDILIGEVWVCGGQSNMEWGLNSTANGADASAKSENKNIRLFTVPRGGAPQAETDVASQWVSCDPQNTPGFTAVGYYFGRDLEKALNVPVGLINSNVGGTEAERWLTDEAIKADPELAKLDPNRGRSDLYNHMIAPLTQFPIRGAIWYQGESNAGRAWQYRALLPAMIKCWRDAWHQPEFPFLVVQLAPFQAIRKEPGDSSWAELRDAQLHTAQHVPNVGLAVITDVGDEKDIHPQRKREVGERLALAALAMTYGKKIAYSGPIYEKMTTSGDKVMLNFKHVGTGLTSKGDTLEGFTIAGEDKRFYNANAKLEGDTVTVWSDKVAQPKAVRYGWDDYPTGNLWNKDGLPASPFRTDDFSYTSKDHN